jgi:serine/threonine protein kinase
MRTVGPTSGPFDCTTLLGQGGFGEVHRACHVRLATDVAVKLIRPGPSDPPAEEWLREPRIVANLGMHPHVFPVLDTGLTGDGRELFVVMPLAQGSLEDRLRRAPTLAPAAALEIARQLAVGLQFIHARGIVHFDLKPSNVFYVEDDPGQPRFMLADFGLATHVRPGGQASQFGGTWPYLSPELLDGVADARADLWALGVTLFRMLSGRLPFEGEGRAVEARIRRGERLRLADLQPELPTPVVAMVERALAPAPSERPADARSFRAAVEATLDRVAPKGAPELVLSQRTLLETLSAARNPAQPFVVTLSVDTSSGARPRDVVVVPGGAGTLSSFRSGDELRLVVSSERDGFLTLTNVGTSGKVTPLFPNEHAPAKRLRAGERCRIPAAGDPFRLQLGGPPGRELIKAIVSDQPLDLGELTVVRGGLRARPPGYRTRDVQVLEARERLAAMPPGSWAEATLELDVASER